MVPAKTVPANTVPANTVPANTVPANTVPANTVPANTVPANTVPANTARPANEPRSCGVPGRGARLAARARAGRAAAVGGHRRGVRPAPRVGARAGGGAPVGGFLAAPLRRPRRVAAGMAGPRGGVPRRRRAGAG